MKSHWQRRGEVRVRFAHLTFGPDDGQWYRASGPFHRLIGLSPQEWCQSCGEWLPRKNPGYKNMPVSEYKLALGATLGTVIFTADLSSWYAEAMQHDLFGADVPTCREFLADVARRYPGWRQSPTSSSSPGKSGNFPPQVPNFPRFSFEGGGVQALAGASTVRALLVRASNVFAIFRHLLTAW